MASSPDKILHSHTSNSNKHSSPTMNHDASMTFNVNFVHEILFKGWSAHSVTSLVLSCVFFFFLAIISEMLKYAELKLSKKESKIRSGLCSPSRPDDNNDCTELPDRNKINVGTCAIRQADIAKIDSCRFFCEWRRWIGPHVLKSLVYGFRTTINYMMMLVAMTYNVYLFISIMIGFTVGNLLTSLLPNPWSLSEADILCQDCC